jgi:hypothetical protein
LAFRKFIDCFRLTGRSSEGAGVWQPPATADCRLAIVVKRWMLADSRLKINSARGVEAYHRPLQAIDVDRLTDSAPR